MDVEQGVIDELESVTDVYTTDGTGMPGGGGGGIINAPRHLKAGQLLREISVPKGGERKQDDGEGVGDDDVAAPPSEDGYSVLYNDTNSVLTDHEIFRASCEAEERKIMADYTFDYSINNSESFDHDQTMSVISMQSRLTATSPPPAVGSLWTPLPAASPASVGEATSRGGGAGDDATVTSIDTRQSMMLQPQKQRRQPNGQSTGQRSQQQQQRKTTRSGRRWNKKQEQKEDAEEKFDTISVLGIQPQQQPVSFPDLLPGENHAARSSGAKQPTRTTRSTTRAGTGNAQSQNIPYAHPVSPVPQPRTTPPPPTIIVLNSSMNGGGVSRSKHNRHHRSNGDEYNRGEGIVRDNNNINPSSIKRFDCIHWMQTLWGDWVGKAIIICMIVIIVAVAVSVGSLLVSGIRAKTAEQAQSGISSSTPSPSPDSAVVGAPSPRWGDDSTTPASVAPSAQGTGIAGNWGSKFPPAEEPSSSPSGKPSIRVASAPSAFPTRAPVQASVLDPPSVTTTAPVPASTECEDSSTATFYAINYGMQDCAWLSAQPSMQEILCVDGLQATTLCRRTCNSCGDEPAEEPAPAPVETTSPEPAPAAQPDEVTQVPSSNPATSAVTQPPSVSTTAPTTSESSATLPSSLIRSAVLSAVSDATATRIEQDNDSAPARAMAWLEVSGAAADEAQLVQRFALATLAYSAESDQWTTQSSWLDPDTSECDWYGTTCNDSGQVTEIDLRDNNVRGTLPPELALLAGSLTQLNLGRNELEGDFPVEIARGLTNLEILLLDTNEISGRLPEELGQMTNLRQLHLQYNDFTGPVPSSFDQFTEIEELMFWNNDLTGSVPEAVCEFSNLSQLILDCQEVDCDCWTRCFYQCGGSTGIPCRNGGP